MTETMEKLLSVRDLRTYYPTAAGIVRAVDALSFDLAKGSTLGVIGESGSGKSTLLRSILGIVNPPGQIVSGEISFERRDLLRLPAREMDTIRGQQIGMIFQFSGQALNPLLKVGAQVTETIMVHRRVSKLEARHLATRALQRAGFEYPEKVLDLYASEISGGMQQRAGIALAIANEPDLVLADEPTSAVDVTTEQRILQTLLHLQKSLGMAFVVVSHNIHVVEQLADEVLVMYAGKCVEQGPRDAVLRRPQHPYTVGLLDSLPSLSKWGGQRLKEIPGSPPVLTRLPAGCPFAPRCQFAQPRCTEEKPKLVPTSDDRSVACYFPRNL